MRSLSECKIMIVDDTESNIDLLLEALNNDYTISVAMDGESALEHAVESTPDLILLDIMMPGMDGYEVIKRLKSDTATRDIPVIFCTVMSEAEDETKGLELGAVDYIRKPFSPPIVKARVKNHLELKLAQESLKEQNSILRENIRLREEVECITRHDLKTPLNAFINIPDLLIRDGGLSDNQIEMLQMLMKSAYLMLGMINSSLDLYRMETGTYQLHPVPVDLLKLLNQIRGETRDLMRVKRLSQEIWLGEKQAWPGDEFLVAGDEMLCYSMLANLIKNAVEASPPDETIRITLNGSSLPTAVIHNRGAVPEDIRDRFFDKYATSGKKDGTGLGTYSAALIAKTLGGSIRFETSEDAGTTLTVKLLEAVKETTEEPTSHAPELVPSPVKIRTSRGRSSRILVVDDYQSMRKIVIGILKQMGFTAFREAANGLQAMEILETERMDMIIADRGMPNMTGIELLACVRTRPELKHIPFVIISGEAREEDMAEVAKWKVNGYLIKPFPPDILKAKVDKLIP